MFLRTANIKLIPKKGDTSQIKNWRPISLLNCFYKIISRVITKRLRKYMDKLTPICQKGYSGSRYCQEVLISVIESIEKCNTRKKRAGILSLDIKKAFDSLSHSFLNGVYKFFNFGPNLIKWITLMCTNRKACVIIDEMLTTNFFDLERGNAQGDTISPFLFNLGYQILLFKLDLSFQIEGILSDFAERAQAHQEGHGQGQGRVAQVHNPDPKAFALADDCSLLVRLEIGNLQNILETLQNFESISGLGCNVEKTALMIVGTQLQAEQGILDMGFEIKNEIVLLGAKIKNTGKCYDGNLPVILEKINKQVNFWKRFNLSLPGRISIAKTFLYSQINYLGCILPWDYADMSQVSRLIEEFVVGKLKISKQRIYQKRSEGGLELFNVSDYLGAQCCSWIKRSVSLDDLWKKELLMYSYGSVFNLRQAAFDKKLNPILHHIAGKFEKFLFNFTTIKENFMSAFFFENPCCTFDINRQHFLKKTFFSAVEWQEYSKKIKNLSLNMLINRDYTVIGKPEFEELSGIELSEIKFNKLRGLANAAIQKFKKPDKNDQKCDTVQNFLMRIRKGSKRIRMVMDSPPTSHVSPNMLKYGELTETIIDANNSGILNSSWNYSFLHNSTRTFIFKLHNAQLGLNSRVAHFVRNHPPTCTFCDIRRVPEENSESTKHLFFDCNSVEGIITDLYTWIFNSNERRDITRTEFFVGFNTGNIWSDQLLLLINLLVKKFIWDCKLRFSLPKSEDLKNTVISELKRTAVQNRNLKEKILKSGLVSIINELHF